MPLPSRHRRPSAPEALTQDQRVEWDAIVRCMPADWFPRETHGLLTQCCRHVCQARFLAEMINTLKADWLKEEGGLERYDTLLRMAERESRAIAALARAMRLTQQSRLRPETAARRTAEAPIGPRPWDLPWQIRSQQAEQNDDDGEE